MRLVWVVGTALLAGCGAEAPPPTEALSFPAGPGDELGAWDGTLRAPLVLAQLGPAHFGQSVDLQVTGAVAGESVYFLQSLAGTGPGQCPASLGGLCIDLLDPVTNLGPIVADGSGVATLTVALPPSGPNGISGWIQTVVRRGAGGSLSEESNVVQVTVTYDNTAPVAVDDAYVTDEDVPLVTDAVSGVLANDTDADLDPLTSVPMSGPANGTVVPNPDGSFTYTPDPDWFGVDSFTYVADDGLLQSDVATVTIDVTAVNDPPVGTPESFGGLREDDVFTSGPGQEVLNNDVDVEGEAMTAEMDTQPPAGEGSVALSSDGSFVYTPAPNYNGSTGFFYRARDASGGLSDPIGVGLNVFAVNDPPMSLPDSYATGRDVPLVVAAPGPLGNDTEVDGDVPLTMEEYLLAVPQHGDWVFAADGSFTYTPDLCYQGPEDFQYRPVDSTGRQGAPTDIHIDVALGAPPDPAYCDAYTPIVAEFAIDSTPFQGFETFSHIPAAPAGVAFLFHGGASQASHMMLLDGMALANELVARGIGVVWTDSTNRVPGSWDLAVDTSSNLDWIRLDALRDDLIASTALTASTPVVSVGFSRGGEFASSFAQMGLAEAWPLSSVQVLNAAPMDLPVLPTFFVSGQNDNVVSPAQVASAHAVHTGPKELREHTEGVLHPMQLMEHPGIGHQLSQDHFDALVVAGGIDAAGNRLATGDLDGFIDAYVAGTALPGGAAVDVTLRTVWAMHKVSAEFAVEQGDFIELHL